MIPLAVTPPTTTIARYLAAGGAHITVTGAVLAERTAEFEYTVGCEACRTIAPNWAGPYNMKAEAENIANRHAAQCRRIPVRLWPLAAAS